MTTIGQFSAGGAAVVLNAGDVADTHANLEEALSVAAGDSVASAVYGDRFVPGTPATRRVLMSPPLASMPVASFTAAADPPPVALVFPGPDDTRMFVAANIAGTGVRWADVAQMREFYALPQATRTTQKQNWSNRLRNVPAAKWPAGIDQSKAALTALAAPMLRLLVGALAGDTFTIHKLKSGAETDGVTDPLFAYPLVEPQCYLRVIAKREGWMESINAWDAGAGISIGPIQFNADSGAIIKFLRALDRADPELFDACFGGNQWSTADVAIGGQMVPVLDINAGAANAIRLIGAGTSKTEQNRIIGYFQSGNPATPSVVDAGWRSTLAAQFVRLVAWPHAQAVIDQVAGEWLAPGLATIAASGLPAIDVRDPDHDLFKLKALLLSAYVRYSNSLAPLLKGLKPYATAGAKVAHIQQVLLDTSKSWPELSTKHRHALADRLAAQEGEADAVWQTIHALAGSSPIAPAAMVATPVVEALPHAEETQQVQGPLPMAGLTAAGAADIVVDPTLAVPPFTPDERRRLAQPLLGASQSATALSWNLASHPAQSGVSAAAIRAAIGSYVDLQRVAAALGLPVRTDFDAVLVEAVHQFQVRVSPMRPSTTAVPARRRSTRWASTSADLGSRASTLQIRRRSTGSTATRRRLSPAPATTRRRHSASPRRTGSATCCRPRSWARPSLTARTPC